MANNCLNSDLYTKNRNKYLKKLKPQSISIFHSNDQMPTNADGLMPFRQNNNLLYLCGIDQEETVLILFPDHPKEELQEILFIKKTSPLIKIWEGEKVTKEQAKKISGVKNVLWFEDYDDVIKKIIKKAKNVYLSHNDHPRANIIVESRNRRMGKRLISKFTNLNLLESSPVLNEIRSIKDDSEINIIKHACEITRCGFNRVLKFIKPNVMEYNIEAEIIHEFKNHQSKGFAYEPIIASGKNACVLHYTSNNKKILDGDLILMDFGAEYLNYASDLTRCVPANGRFTKRQKQVYDAVLRVMKASKKLLKPGVFLKDYEIEVGQIMEKELVDLNLISMNDIKRQTNIPAYKKYYMHGTSHHLGLDVHDVSNPKKELKEGMVLTCEPGIYIPEESLGIRLENDVVIKENSCQDLMDSIIIESGEIEDAMN